MDTLKKYRYTVPDIEHEGDYQPFASAITDGGGIIVNINWSGEDGDDAIIHFTAKPEQLESIKNKLIELL